MLAPLQDGHSQVAAGQSVKVPEKKKPRGSEGAEPTPLLSNTFLSTIVPTVLKAEKVLVMKDDWSCTAASSPPTSAYSLPNPPSHSPLSLPSESARYVTEILQFAFSPLSTGRGEEKKTRAHSVSVKIWTP